MIEGLGREEEWGAGDEIKERKWARRLGLVVEGGEQHDALLDK